MGDLVHFRTKEIGSLVKYIESVIDASELVKDVDFEIISLIVLDKEFKAHSLGGFLGTKSNEVFQGKSGFLKQANHLINENVRNNEVEAVFATEYQHSSDIVFYKINGGIDIDLATEVGLGVVLYNGVLMLYSPKEKGNSMDTVYEVVKLKVYFQLIHPESIDENLKGSFKKNADLIQSLMLIDSWKHIGILEEIFGY
ncbi:hypothetical protein [Paenibacillus vini]|uniref:Uncharacterized protein n=1 Tax=Paenibacillus vini TaxID=1476024 RepID=A0ABQ4MAC5_9BACL|nr:hypothetical protein [Paenibacillus vini]GIP52920.1 hypothetical protein J42TS3_19550 [Paenibacillus vini]